MNGHHPIASSSPESPARSSSAIGDASTLDTREHSAALLIGEARDGIPAAGRTPVGLGERARPRARCSERVPAPSRRRPPNRERELPAVVMAVDQPEPTPAPAGTASPAPPKLTALQVNAT